METSVQRQGPDRLESRQMEPGQYFRKRRFDQVPRQALDGLLHGKGQGHEGFSFQGRRDDQAGIKRWNLFPHPIPGQGMAGRARGSDQSDPKRSGQNGQRVYRKKESKGSGQGQRMVSL